MCRVDLASNKKAGAGEVTTCGTEHCRGAKVVINHKTGRFLGRQITTYILYGLNTLILNGMKQM